MPPRLLFGLGNPGPRYQDTRHNAGWQVLDVLAREGNAVFRPTRFLLGETADLREGDVHVRMVKPHSYMNLCGPVYVRALEVFEVPPEEALVVSDDFMLPFGRLRLRAEGSSGGHNGLRSIGEALGSDVFPRLRLGIGPVPPPMDPTDFVLMRYEAEQRKALPDLLDRAAAACRTWAREGMDAAMNRHNKGEGPPPPPPPPPRVGPGEPGGYSPPLAPRSGGNRRKPDTA
jgi:PTH1 family peptidyl-tRNA hydrolase